MHGKSGVLPLGTSALAGPSAVAILEEDLASQAVMPWLGYRPCSSWRCRISSRIYTAAMADTAPSAHLRPPCLRLGDARAHLMLLGADCFVFDQRVVR